MSRGRRNHFQWQEQRNGKDFLENQSPNDMKSFHVPRIIRDISRGSIDFREEEYHLSNKTLIIALLDVAWQKYTFHSISANGVMLLLDAAQYQQQDEHTISTITGAYEIHNKTSEVYRLVYEAFSVYNDTGDIEQLYPLSNQIRGYSDYI